jgi:hypothetical protein
MNKGCIRPGQRLSPETEIKKGQRLSRGTEFKSGQKSHNRLPVGTVEAITKSEHIEKHRSELLAAREIGGGK